MAASVWLSIFPVAPRTQKPIFSRRSVSRRAMSMPIGGCCLSASPRRSSVPMPKRWFGCANRNYPLAHFHLTETLALLGQFDEARAAAQAGLALQPDFTLRRYRENALSDNPAYLAGRKRSCEGMRLAGVPEG